MPASNSTAEPLSPPPIVPPLQLRSGVCEADATIMIVDDEPSTVQVVRAYLEDAGFHRFVTTTDSASAVSTLEMTHPDILMLDLMMPRVNGFDILAALREREGVGWIPTVVLTSSTDLESRHRALGLGAADFLAKPVDPTELALRVRNNLAVKLYEDELRREQERSEKLVAELLPAAVARRLKQGERCIAERFDAVTVLFADLTNFTKFASTTDPASVVELLNYLFESFDDIVGRRGLEKIKTVGDAYMLAGGVPEPSPGHADAVVLAGLEMLDMVDLLRMLPEWGLSVRIGVHTGPVIAGVIGRSRYSYDLWGDTVNVAARLQNAGFPGFVHISESTRAALSGGFVIDPRPPIDVRGKGEMQTYLVARPARKSR